MVESNSITEDRIKIMIAESISSYHKENVGRFDGLAGKMDEVTELINKGKGVFFTLIVIGGAPAFVYYVIKIIEEAKK